MNIHSHEHERARIPSGTPASSLPGNLYSHPEAKKSGTYPIPVPPGWKRLLFQERVVYVTPSGIRLKNLVDVRDYLTTEGTCKCGLVCGLHPDNIFDFDHRKPSELGRYESGVKGCSSPPSCQHCDDDVSSISSHLHCPKLSEEKKSKKRKKKKKYVTNGLGLENVKAKEAEKQRIHEIINEQKKEYEDQQLLKQQTGLPSHIVSGNSSQTGLLPSQIIQNPQTAGLHPSQIVQSSQTGLPSNIVPTSQHSMPFPVLQQAPMSSFIARSTTQVNPSGQILQAPSLKHPSQPVQILAQSQPVMQLVNTLNGPILMPLANQSLIGGTGSKDSGKNTKPGQTLVLGHQQTLFPTPGIMPSQQKFIMQPQGIILQNGVLMQAPPTQTQQPQQQQQQQILYNPFPEGSTITYSQSNSTTPRQSQIYSTCSSPSPQTYIMTNTGQLLPSNLSQQPHMDILNNNNLNSVHKPPHSPPPPKLTKEVSPQAVEELEESKRKHQRSLMIHSFNKKSRKSHPSSTSKKMTFLQSNRVDSSGLRATPPHATSNANNINSNNNNNDTTFDALLASAKNSTPLKAGVKCRRPSANRILFMESDESEFDEEDDMEDDYLEKRRQESKTKAHDKKKRKKRNADDLIIQRHNSITHSDGEEDYSLDDSGTSGNSSHNAEDFKVGDLVWGPFGAFPSWPGKLVRGADEDQKVMICWFGSKTITEEDPTVLKTLSEGFDAHHKERKKMRKSRKLNASLEKAIQEAMMELDNEESMRCS